MAVKAAEVYALITARDQEFRAAMQRIESSSRQAGAAVAANLNRSGPGFDMVNAKSQKLGQVFQQASFGAQDFLTVLAGGGGLSRALMSSSNNMAQVLTVLGPMAGAFGGLAITAASLVPLFFGIGSAADENVLKIDNMDAAMRRLLATLHEIDRAAEAAEKAEGIKTEKQLDEAVAAAKKKIANVTGPKRTEITEDIARQERVVLHGLTDEEKEAVGKQVLQRQGINPNGRQFPGRLFGLEQETVNLVGNEQDVRRKRREAQRAAAEQAIASGEARVANIKGALSPERQAELDKALDPFREELRKVVSQEGDLRAQVAAMEKQRDAVKKQEREAFLEQNAKDIEAGMPKAGGGAAAGPGAGGAAGPAHPGPDLNMGLAVPRELQQQADQQRREAERAAQELDRRQEQARQKFAQLSERINLDRSPRQAQSDRILQELEKRTNEIAEIVNGGGATPEQGNALFMSARRAAGGKLSAMAKEMEDSIRPQKRQSQFAGVAEFGRQIQESLIPDDVKKHKGDGCEHQTGGGRTEEDGRSAEGLPTRGGAMTTDTKQLYTDPAAFRAALVIDADGQTVRLADVLDGWQQQDFAAMDPAWQCIAGARRNNLPEPIRRAYLERPRGHSKTTDIAVMVTWALFASARHILGYVAAADREQGRLLRTAVLRLLQLNPWLSKYLDVQHFKIANKHTESTVDILSSDVAASWGRTPDFIVCDELTHWRNGELWESLFSAAAKRKHCVLVIISNAGHVDSWQWGVREAARTSDSWYFHSLDGPQASWLSQERLAEQKAMLPALQYARYWLNEWTAGASDALTDDVVRAAVTTERPTGRENGLTYVGGLDLALKRDWSAFAVVGRHDGWTDRVPVERAELPFWQRARIDAGLMADPRGPEYRVVDHAGTGRVRLQHVRRWKPPRGGQVSLEAVKQDILDAHGRFGLAAVFYDPTNAGLLAEQLRAAGVPMVEVSFSSPANLAAMAEAVTNSFNDGMVDLYPDKDLLRDLRTMRIKETHYGGVRLEFPRDRHGHGDIGTAFALALLGTK